MRDADCEGAPPAAGCVLVAQSEHEGGVGGGCGIWTTAGLSLARPEAAAECYWPRLGSGCWSDL